MKRYLNLFIALIFSFETSWAELACRHIVDEDKVQNTETQKRTQKVISKDEAAEMALQFVNKKMLMGNIQQVALIVSHKEIIEDPYDMHGYYSGKLINLHSADKEKQESDLKKLLTKYDLRTLYSNRRQSGKDLDKLINEEQAFNEADKEFIKIWKQRSFLVLERMDIILDKPQDERNSDLDAISKYFNVQDSRQDLIQALAEIRNLRENFPEQYEIFKQTWMATLPVVAKAGKKNTRKFFTETIAGATTFIGLSAAGISTIASYFGVSGPEMFFGSIGSVVASVFLSKVGESVNPFYTIEKKLRSLSFKKLKSISRENVIEIAKEKLNLSSEKASALVDKNTSQERSILNQLQDKTMDELLDLLKNTEESLLGTPEQLSRYQVLQMQLMSQISNQFSILSERQENIRAQTDTFIQEAEQVAQLKESEKREKVTEISNLHKDAIEFSLDVNSLERLTNEASDQITQNMMIISALMKNENVSRESKALMEQLLTQSAIMDGMKEALSVLSKKTEQDAEMITKLSLGIMAGRVTNLMKNLKAAE